MVTISQPWYNGLFTMAAKPIKSLELQFLIIIIILLIIIILMYMYIIIIYMHFEMAHTLEIIPL